MRRASPLLFVLVATVAVAGCGTSAKRAGNGGPPLRVSIAAPGGQSTTPARTLTVRGSVSPADASVQVLGQPADVVAGAFTARVALQPGANVIDLEATAKGHGPTLTAVRVTREMPIVVPDLSHLSTDDARASV